MKKEELEEMIRKAIKEEMTSKSNDKQDKEKPEHVFSSEEEMTDFVLKELKEKKKIDREGKCVLCGREEPKREEEYRSIWDRD